MKQKATKEKAEQSNRIDFISNQTKILATFKKLMTKNGKKPTPTEISDESGISLRTVKRHLRKLRCELYLSDFRILTDEIVVALYEKAKEGRAPEVKLWMQLIENWRETQGITHSGEIKFEKINFVMEE